MAPHSEFIEKKLEPRRDKEGAIEKASTMAICRFSLEFSCVARACNGRHEVSGAARGRGASGYAGVRAEVESTSFEAIRRNRTPSTEYDIAKVLLNLTSVSKPAWYGTTKR